MQQQFIEAPPEIKAILYGNREDVCDMNEVFFKSRPYAFIRVNGKFILKHIYLWEKKIKKNFAGSFKHCLKVLSIA